MKKNILFVILSTFLMLGFTQCNDKTKETPKPTDPKEELAKLLEGTAEGMKGSFPVRINATTELAACVVRDGHILEYTYKGIDLSVSQFDSVSFKLKVEEDLKAALKTNEQTKLFTEKGATLSYIYTDKNDKYLCKMVFTPEDLK